MSTDATRLTLVSLLLAPAAALVLPAADYRRWPVRVQQPALVRARCEPPPQLMCSPAPNAEAADEPAPGPLDAPLPQAVLCLVGYMFHVCVLSRNSLRIAGRALGWDTLTGLGVLAAAAWRRKRVLGKAMPPWLDGSGSGDEAASCLDLSGAPAGREGPGWRGAGGVA